MPIKHKDFATIKSTNYLLNALVVMEAEEKGANVGIWLDEDGNIAEGQNMNVGFLTNEGELLLPPFDRILSGCTAKRVLELVPQLIKENAIPGLKSVKQTKISLSEAKIAAEMMIIISGEMIMPVVEWDGKPVGNGKFVSATIVWSYRSSCPEIFEDLKFVLVCPAFPKMSQLRLFVTSTRH